MMDRIISSYDPDDKMVFIDWLYATRTDVKELYRYLKIYEEKELYERCQIIWDRIQQIEGQKF